MNIFKKEQTGVAQTKVFIALWDKFYRIYRRAIMKQNVSAEDSKIFIENRDIMRKKYKEIEELVKQKISEIDIEKSGPVIDILNIENLSSMSDKELKKNNDTWRRTFQTLNYYLDILEKTGHKNTNIFEFFKFKKRNTGRH